MDKGNIRVLVSACLLGINCRYDGKNSERDDVRELLKGYELIPVCPERLGGMETPREPSECLTAEGAVHVMTRKGEDVTGFFVKGGEEAWKIAARNGCRYAVLKEHSPSCGSSWIYDGSFTGTKIRGEGVTARILRERGVKVVGESDISRLLLEIRSDMINDNLKNNKE